MAAVDVGGTGTRVRLLPGGPRADAPGVELPAPGRTVGADGIDTGSLLTGLAEALRQERAARPGGLPPVAAVGVGLSGLLGLTADPEALCRGLAELLGADRVVLAADVVTSYVGALGVRPGAVVAAGTGAVALGTDFAKRWVRRDGWGHLLGDAGSGAWIGQAGLRAALRAHDGRADGSATLLAAAVQRFGSPEGWPARLYPHGDVAGRMAAFAPDVASAAEDGDPTARAVWRRAAEHLADTVVAALPTEPGPGTESGPGTEPVVSWCGSLFRAGELLAAPFREAVRAARPDARLVPPAGSSLDGAAALATLVLTAPDRLPDAAPYLRVWTRDGAARHTAF
ncbi:N-acetylglucosamine kinase [Streptomyces solincola]|uniref:N-acetylglucosamine kinase n=1 Tax=Streptomyces solincola TaxID=2100817 RepID=UPI001C615000|nr:BadF/BadG/BcrA/BcrD ATPase family protein [Streptomyces solincola]